MGEISEIKSGLPNFLHWQGKKPTLTLANLRELLMVMGYTCRYNLISKEEEVLVPYLVTTPDNARNAAYAVVLSTLVEHQMPTHHLDSYLTKICDENPYNPVKTWIESKAWDGKDRLPELFATIDSANNEAKEWFIYRWMIGAVASAYSPEGMDSNGVLVLQGRQDMGKTWWFRKLCPRELQKADASINPSDRDSVAQVIGYWLVELGELDATFRKSDIAALKSFITRQEDTLRMPYAKRSATYPRRTVFAASVNDINYLHDTENRRYWTIECKSVNSYHDIDMQQVWAQIHTDWMAGESPALPENARAALKEINKNHEQIDPIQEMILTKYNWDSVTYSSEWKTSTQIAQDIGLKNITKKETNSISRYVMEMNGNQKKRTNDARLLLVPFL